MIPTMKSLDTLKIYERLKKVETFDAQARELAEVLRELVDDQIATKNDLEKVKNELGADIEKTNAKVEHAKLELEAKIAQSKSEIIKWVAGLLLAQAGLIAAMVKLL